MSKSNSGNSKGIHRIEDPDYIVYTDGGCDFNPGGPGGYGVVILNNKTGEYSEFSGGLKGTTNNRMELLAAIVALEALPSRASARLYSDSQYLVNGLSGEWELKKNFDLWKRLRAAARGKKIDIRWVRGHNGDAYNEVCDNLARKAMYDEENERDTGYFGYTRKGRSFAQPVKTSEDVSPELGARPIPTTVDEYVKTYNVHAVCAQLLLRFMNSTNRGFKNYLALKTGGVDAWSNKSLDQIFALIPDAPEVYDAVSECLPQEKDVMTVMRWYARGLSAKDAIRKVEVSNEVAGNCMNSAKEVYKKNKKWEGKFERKTDYAEN